MVISSLQVPVTNVYVSKLGFLGACWCYLFINDIKTIFCWSRTSSKLVQRFMRNITGFQVFNLFVMTWFEATLVFSIIHRHIALAQVVQIRWKWWQYHGILTKSITYSHSDVSSNFPVLRWMIHVITPQLPPQWFHMNVVILFHRLIYCVISAQKRKNRQDDCPGRHWGRWSLSSTSSVTSWAVVRRPFCFSDFVMRSMG